jgi:hypothetical protein
MDAPGADVIVSKTRLFMARRREKREERGENLARHEWLSLAHDDIGAWEGIRLFYQFKKLMPIVVRTMMNASSDKRPIPSNSYLMCE